MHISLKKQTLGARGFVAGFVFDPPESYCETSMQAGNHCRRDFRKVEAVVSYSSDAKSTRYKSSSGMSGIRIW
jgi:hypothetical protein